MLWSQVGSWCVGTRFVSELSKEIRLFGLEESFLFQLVSADGRQSDILNRYQSADKRCGDTVCVMSRFVSELSRRNSSTWFRTKLHLVGSLELGEPAEFWSVKEFGSIRLETRPGWWRRTLELLRDACWQRHRPRGAGWVCCFLPSRLWSCLEATDHHHRDSNHEARNSMVCSFLLRWPHYL